MKNKINPVNLNYLKPLKHLHTQLTGLIRRRLWLQILIALFLGFATGIILSPDADIVSAKISPTIANWLAFPGHLFLVLIQMIVLPLIIASVVRGIAASEDMENLKRLGSRSALYFIGTTFLSTILGIQIALWIKPGQFIDSSKLLPLATEHSLNTGGLTEKSIPDSLLQILPNNPLEAMLQGQLLQVVLFSLIIGVALISLPKKQSEPLLNLLSSVQSVCMTVVRWAMRLAPLAVFGLIADIAFQVGFHALLGMGVYVFTVLFGLLIMLFFYLTLVWIVDGRTPWNFLSKIRETQLLAFSTSSSAAVMPLSIKTADEDLGIRPSISQFLIPLGTTINMDGTALYQGIATVFLAQVFQVDLSFAALALVVFTSVGASIGSPGTPGVGIVILASVLESAGIPGSGVALILGVDRLLDMSRTAINVTGDLTACIVMDHWLGSKIADIDAATPQNNQEKSTNIHDHSNDHTNS